MTLSSTTSDYYIPERQDIVQLNCSPSAGQEIRSWHPAVVISRGAYSQLTGLVLVAPITHATHNRLKDSGLLIPLNLPEVDGFVNPLQLFTFDYRKRHVRKIGQLPDYLYAQVRVRVNQLLE